MTTRIKGTEILICGAGIIGLTIARELLKHGFRDIVVIEKERDVGMHASGRNSGVLHAGIYYSKDSLKARTCLKGNKLMKEYCKEKNLPLLETGKVIVARDEKELPLLKELFRRGLQNGAKVELIDEKDLSSVEPHARTRDIALYSYDTAIVDPHAIMRQLYKDLVASGVKVLFNTTMTGIERHNIIKTNHGLLQYDFFINSAGAYSDKIAHLFDIGHNYTLLPFKGFYKILIPEKGITVRGNIYPVPGIDYPFLGIHFSRSINGHIYVGPTAMPAWGRENYGVCKGMDMEIFKFFHTGSKLFLKNRQFRLMAISEIKKYSTRYFFKEAKDLVKNIHITDLLPSSKVGIRPQLIDVHKRELVMDYVILRDQNSLHILNTISPGFTSSMEFAKFVVSGFVRK